MNLGKVGERFACGQLVVLLDDGPVPRPAVLAAAAWAIEPAAMAGMVRHTSGFVTVSLPAARCDNLGLPSLAHDPFSCIRPVAAVSADARSGISTGISATDRCATARVLADPSSIPSDFCRPGHVVPMRVPMAAPRGADARSRQIFAAMDLCEWLERPPAVVSSVLVAALGETLTNAEAVEFAAALGLAVLPASAVPSALSLAAVSGATA